LFPDGSCCCYLLRTFREVQLMSAFGGEAVIRMAVHHPESCTVNMPRHGKGARLWLRPSRRKSGRVIANAVWIIIDRGRHIATGCPKSEAREAEKKLAAYIADKHRPSRLVKDIDQIRVADVLSIYLDDCGPRTADQPKLEATINRLNDYWGSKVLSQVTAAECRAYVHIRGKTGDARADLETLRAAINHHAKEGMHHGIVRVTLPRKGLPRDRWLTRGEAARLICPPGGTASTRPATAAGIRDN
jgi:hypothetical protein